MLSLLLLLSSGAHAASLDNLDIGGPWGTPNATDSTAIWWNPAAMAAGKGTTFMLDVAPILAGVTFERDHDTFPGTDNYSFFGVAPFIGATSDFGVDGLGLGFAVFAPYALGAKTMDGSDGVGAYQVREGTITGLQAMLGASYQIKNIFSLGFSGGLLYSRYDAFLNLEATTALADSLSELGIPHGYDANNVEDPAYSTQTHFGPLEGYAFVYNVGMHIQPHKMVGIGIAYNGGYGPAPDKKGGTYVDHAGQVELDFGCPPEEDDAVGYFGAILYGICDANVTADATIGYAYPHRIHGGIQLHPTPPLLLELMGGVVFWKQFDTFDIEVSNPVKTMEGEDDNELSEDAVALISEDRPWARDNVNSFFVGVDAKVRVHEKVLIGGRVLFDQHAVPDEVLSNNNYDADRFMLSALGAYEPVPWLQIGLSFTQHILFTRTTTTSSFNVYVDADERAAFLEDYGTAYQYPQTNGTYSAHISRFGLSFRGQFGQKKDG